MKDNDSSKGNQHRLSSTFIHDSSFWNPCPLGMMVDVAILFVKKHFRHNRQAIHVEISQAFLDVLLSEGQRAFLVMKLVHALANSVIEANFWQITAKGTFCNFEALFQKFLANKRGRNRSAVFVAFNNGFSSSSGKCWVDRLLRRPTFLGSLGSSLAISRRMASCATFTPTPVTRASSLRFGSFFPHLWAGPRPSKYLWTLIKIRYSFAVTGF